MFNFLMGIPNTGDNARPWLVAICMIVSIIVVVTLFIIGQKNKTDEDDFDE